MFLEMELLLLLWWCRWLLLILLMLLLFSLTIGVSARNHISKGRSTSELHIGHQQLVNIQTKYKPEKDLKNQFLRQQIFLK